MIWNKPRNVWQWLLLVAPAILTLVATQTMQWWMPQQPMHYMNGMEVQPGLVRLFRDIDVTCKVLIPACVIVAFVLSHGPPLGQRIVNAVFFFLCLLFGNGFLAVVGCSVGDVVRPVEKRTAPASVKVRNDPGRDQGSDQ